MIKYVLHKSFAFGSKTSFRLIQGLILSLLALNCHAETLPSAESKQALVLFKQAEQAYARQQYQSAMDLYQEAIRFHAEDGPIQVDQDVVTNSIGYGRLATLVQAEDKKYQQYFPNQRLTEIQNIFNEQQRRSNPPLLDLQWVTLRDPTRDNILDGGETGELVLTIENKGQSTALDIVLNLTTEADSDLIATKNINIGDINAGESTTANLEITAEHNIDDRIHSLQLQALEKGGFDSNPLEVFLHTKPHQPAKIQLEHLTIEDFNHNGLVEPTETITIKADISNRGAGVSEPVQIAIDLGENIFLVPGSQPNINIGKLYPRESKPIQFSFVTNRRFQHLQKLDARLLINTGNNKQSLVQDLQLTMHMPKDRVSVSVNPVIPPPSNNNASNFIDVDTNIPTGESKKKDAVAVIIGNKNYQIKGLPPVQYSLNDARTLKKFLIKTLGFDEHNIIYLENATAARFTETFGSSNSFAGKLYNYVKPGKSDVFIYYSGHGAPDLQNKGAYFVPVDVDPNYIATSGYPLDLFYKNISKLPAKSITIVLDTCFSGNSDGGFLLKNISPAMINVKKVIPSIHQGAIFTSSQEDQISTWYHDKRHSLFTYYFLKGLTGIADTNKDSSITTTELGRYLADIVPLQARKLGGHIQVPSLTQQEELVLTTLIDKQVSLASPKQ